jgi:hypothetical protein
VVSVAAERHGALALSVKVQSRACQPRAAVKFGSIEFYVTKRLEFSCIDDVIADFANLHPAIWVQIR